MNLRSRYLGLQLAHPIVAAASPLTATLDGMRRLEDAGAAAVVMASLYEEQIRAEDNAYAMFTEHGSNSQAEADLKAFEALVGSWPLVRECHMLAGETDFLLKVVAHDWDAYQKFLTTNLTPAPNVSHVKSALAIRSSKQLPGVPIEVEDPKPARVASGE
jgi:DNA-binding Lrp family transcriptional regulator